MSLNKAQREAVFHREGPCLVLAGPGSGKTLTIVRRIEALLNDHLVKPEEILVITFTKYAAREMRERFYRLMNGAHPPVTFGTFHGIYYGILKWAYHLGPQNLISEEEKYKLLRSIAGQYGLEAAEEQEFLQNLAAEIGSVKNNRLQVHAYEAKACPQELFRKIYMSYERKRKQQRKLDFDDMLTLCCDLFESRSDILARWQEKYKYILVDEFQDINQVQYDVIKMLAAPQNHLFVVGDDDQSIYGFRGAKAALMFQFEQDYPDARRLILDLNYRSTENIVNCAKKVIENNQLRFKKNIRAVKPVGVHLHVQETVDSEEEARYVTEQIQGYLKDGIAPEQIAVLFRTRNVSGALTEELTRNRIVFWMREQISNIYTHFIGENFGAYFRLAIGGRRRQDFLRIMNRPTRYISRESLETAEVSFEDIRDFYEDRPWMQERIDQMEEDLQMMSTMTPYGAIQFLRKGVGYDEFLREYAKNNRQREEELFEIVQEIENRSKVFVTLEDWLEHVQEYTEKLQVQRKETTKSSGKGVQLMTLHSAKGLEFDTVFLLSVNEGILPYQKMQTEEEVEEERRLFYVGMTRAKERLVISYATSKNGKEVSPSRFVEEIFAED